ncbi:glycosyltransferase [Rhizobium tubonense]|uniref:Glycosyl transferase family 1 n=1 Tax=Rhizobium tubonense TaxID=484088 RepID=A0A2W4C7I6_9HYPH|nr:glycosyltransferase [Rhizobium tubonense]PZM08921.1 glycosyl transferase family 1 [Rhizobium tubonense]
MTRKPRVVLATDSIDPSGMGEHMLALGRALGKRWDVTIALMAVDPNRLLLARAARHGLGIKLALDTDELTDWLSRSNIDILHVHAGIGWEGHELTRAASISAIPVIRTEHLPYLLTDPEQINHFRRETERVAHHIVVSEASRCSFVEAQVAPSRLTLVRNGIFPSRAEKPRSELVEELGLIGKIVLLTVARFTEQKDQASLVRALPEILKANPSVILLFVGSGPEKERVSALADELRLSGQIQFLGQRSDVAEIMAIATLFILPSRFEGLPLAILEAMSLAVPVVATRIGGTLEALGEDHPYLAEPDNPPSLASLVNHALRNPKVAATIGRAGRERFRQNFSVYRMADETGDVYQRFLARPTKQMQEDETMTKTRLGFIGVGGIAHRHLDILGSFEDVEIVAFADPDLRRADQAAMRFGAKSFGHHREMLDTQQLDAVYICIPPFAHGEPERDLIQRHIPFFVEKPVSLDLALAEELAKEISKTNLITGVGYHWRYLDIVDEARNLLVDNPAQLLSGYWLDSTPPPQWWWKQDKSGGQMVEQTTHLLDLARFLVGEVTDVYGRSTHKDRSEFPGLDVPTVTTANLTFDTGVVANIASTCLLGWSHRIGLHIFADKLAIELTDRDIMIDIGRGRPVRAADGDPVWREDRDFIDAVRGGENRIRCPYSDAVATHRLALAVVSSARTGEPIRFDTPRIKRDLAPLQAQPRQFEPQCLQPGHRKIRSLGIEEPGRAYFFEYEEGPPADGRVKLDTIYTGLSAGTELTFMKNSNPYFRSRFDAGRGVFVENEPDLRYPVPFLGYMEVARVTQSRDLGFSDGDVLAASYGHKTGHTADPFDDLLIPLRQEIDPVLGVFVAQMGPIAANGILHADAETFGAQVPTLGAGVAGRPVIVIGAGTVGLMTALFARSLGASEIVITDPSGFRRGKAEAMGLTAMTEEQAWQHAKARWHDGTMGRGADLVFQTRAHARSLHTALKALRPQGTVIDLAFYQDGADALRLGEEFHHNGLNIRCAQINRVPRGLAPLWDRRRLAAATVDLIVAEGRAIREHMITHIVPMDEAPAFLSDLVENRPEFLQVVFKVGG